MNVEVKIIPTYHVAYVRRHGYRKGVFQEHLNAAFQQVYSWVDARSLFRPETLVIGVPHDNPDITPNPRCRYDARVTVPAEVTSGTGEVDVQDLVGGLYAVRRIEVDDPAEIGRRVDGEPGPKTRIRLDFCIAVKPL